MRRWKRERGRLCPQFNHGAGIRDLAVSPNGPSATAAGQAARVWNIADRRLVRALPHPFAVDGDSFDQTGGGLLTIARDVRVFDTASWGQQALLDQRGDIRVAKFSPSGTLVATGGRDGVGTIWDSACWNGPRVAHRSHLRGDGSRRSPRGDLVATASSDNGVRVWWAETGSLATLLAGHVNHVNGVAFAPDGNTIATSSIDGSGRIWWGSPNFARPAQLLGHSKPAVRNVTFSPDGRNVITSSDDGTARVWKAAVDPSASVVLRQSAAGRAVAFSRDGRTIVSGGVDGMIRVARLNGTIVRTIAHPGAVTDVAVSPDGSTGQPPAPKEPRGCTALPTASPSARSSTARRCAWRRSIAAASESPPARRTAASASGARSRRRCSPSSPIARR